MKHAMPGGVGKSILTILCKTGKLVNLNADTLLTDDDLPWAQQTTVDGKGRPAPQSFPILGTVILTSFDDGSTYTISFGPKSWGHIGFDRDGTKISPSLSPPGL
jgi:hypothetical protein